MFITTTIRDWERLFASESERDQVVELLFGTSRSTGAALIAYCVMPHHVHLIAGHEQGGPGVSSFMQAFKSVVSHQMFPEKHGVWLPRFDDLVLVSEEVFRTKLNYIHENPVRAGLVAQSIDWKWSSARFWLLDEPSDALTKSWDWPVDTGAARRGRLAATEGERPKL